MTIETREEHNGPILKDKLIKFSLISNGSLFITNQNLDAVQFYFVIMSLRRKNTDSDDDYGDFKPDEVLNNARNYINLAAGNYAIRATISTDIILAVTE